jgi:hypothetical protein
MLLNRADHLEGGKTKPPNKLCGGAIRRGKSAAAEALLAARFCLSAVVIVSIFDAHLIQGLTVNYGYAAAFVVVLLESSGTLLVRG